MSKGKLAKFADMETYENVFQYPYSVVEHVPFECRDTGMRRISITTTLSYWS